MSIPEPHRRQLAEGRAMAMEIQATGPRRRAFIEVRPEGGARSLSEALAAAKATGALPRAHSFRVDHVEYDADALDGYDYEIGRVFHATVVVTSTDDVAATLRAWGCDPGALRPYFQTDAA